MGTPASWKPGQSGNPKGKPKDPMVQRFREAIEAVERKHGINLLQHYIENSLVDGSLANSVMKKILPDLKQVETDVTLNGSISLEHLTDDDLRSRITELESFGTGRTVHSEAGRKIKKRKK